LLEVSVFGGFIEHFSILPDFRVDRTKKHNLIDILFIAVCTVICGGEGFTDMEDFATAKEEWLRKYLELPGGIPSHDTFRRVFSILDPDIFLACFVEWSRALHEATRGEVIALDGKTIRHSFDRASGQPALHIISAWASENGLALGHVKVDDKSNEITALPKLLEMIDIEGKTVTMDAMGCQKELAQQIVDAGGDYVLCVKGNQVSLHEDLTWFFEESGDFEGIEHTYYESVEKDHGRIEVRKCWAVEDEVKWIGIKKWKGLRSIAAIQAERIIRGASSKETRYYISSLPGDAQKIALAAREHWAIENSLHWVLDVTMNEDMSRVRKDNAPENLATLRRIAINMVKKDKTPMKGRPSIRRAMKRAAYLNASLEQILVS
jgi:predicted transposase YbfD/YdcC